jgi:hypothetical protein
MLELLMLATVDAQIRPVVSTTGKSGRYSELCPLAVIKVPLFPIEMQPDVKVRMLNFVIA